MSLLFRHSDMPGLTRHLGYAHLVMPGLTRHLVPITCHAGIRSGISPHLRFLPSSRLKAGNLEKFSGPTPG